MNIHEILQKQYCLYAYIYNNNDNKVRQRDKESAIQC